VVESSRTYLPAAGRDWRLPLYDPLVKLLGGDAARRALLDEAALRPGQRVLDVGCGTGTLATLIKQLHPEVGVVGLDPDPKALARARRKAARTAVRVQFDQGFETSCRIPRRRSIECFRRSCSTISPLKRRELPCVGCDVCSKPVASFT
jgi:SAM-dependent methyltransferase